MVGSVGRSASLDGRSVSHVDEWWAGQPVSWVGRLASWAMGRSVCWLIDPLFSWSVGHVVGPLGESFGSMGQSVGWLLGWSVPWSD